MILKKWITAAASVGVLTMLMSPATAFEAGNATTTADWLNFRTAPSMTGRVMDLIPEGSEVTILEDLGDWCYIDWNGLEGYVSADYLSQNMPEPEQIPTSRMPELTVSGEEAHEADVTEAETEAETENETEEAEAGEEIETESGALCICGVVNAAGVRFRRLPALDATEPYGYFYNGVIVDVLEIGDEWITISYGDQIGYIAAQYLEIREPSSAELAAAANAFYLPNAPQPRTLSFASSPVKTPTAQNVYSEEETLRDMVDDIISTAKSCLGVPYVYGGTTLRGFDCSGFVYYVFGQNNITMNRTASAQYKQGAYVSKSELQPGDLVFFSGSGSSSIEHVGIYIGDGEFIHASSGAYKKIVTARLDSTYFTRYYYGARRILN